MSQFFVNNTGTSGPTVPTQFTTDFQADQVTPVGISIPSSNNEFIKGGSGISTYVDPNSGPNVFIKIKNSTTDTGQTIGAQTITLSTINCSVAGTYFFTTQVSAYDIAGVESAGGSLYTTVRSTGGVVTVIDDTDAIAHRTSNLTAIDYQIISSGTNAIFQVTGQAGFTLDWGAITIYVYRG